MPLSGIRVSGSDRSLLSIAYAGKAVIDVLIAALAGFKFLFYRNMDGKTANKVNIIFSAK
ncbi:MAG TPA: hypothetical protein V6D10_09390 [Trichocoleus sp.]|jgi:hypothetical protein